MMLYCTQYTVQWPRYTRTLRRHRLCDASPSASLLSDSDDSYTPPNSLTQAHSGLLTSVCTLHIRLSQALRSSDVYVAFKYLYQPTHNMF